MTTNENESPSTAMTIGELQALPTVVSVSVAARALGIGRNTAAAMIRAGNFPVRTLTMGRTSKVPTLALWEVLGLRIGA